MAEDPAVLAGLLVEHRKTDSRVGYPPQLRRRVGSYVARRRAEGVKFSGLASELGVTRTTLAKWARMWAVPESGGFSEVVVVASAAVVPSAVVVPSSAVLPAEPEAADVLQVVSPSGFTLRGISLEQALYALTVLR